MAKRLHPSKINKIRRMRAHGATWAACARECSVALETARKYGKGITTKQLRRLTLDLLHVEPEYVEALPKILGQVQCPACGETLIILRSMLYVQCYHCSHVWQRSR